MMKNYFVVVFLYGRQGSLEKTWHKKKKQHRSKISGLARNVT